LSLVRKRSPEERGRGELEKKVEKREKSTLSKGICENYT